MTLRQRIEGKAGDGLRTRYLNLGKVALYRVSYSRPPTEILPRRTDQGTLATAPLGHHVFTGTPAQGLGMLGWEGGMKSTTWPGRG